MKTLLVISTFVLSTSFGLAQSMTVSCSFLAGTKIAASFAIKYKERSGEVSDKVKITFSDERFAFLEKTLDARLLMESPSDVLDVMDQDIYVEPGSDFDALRVIFHLDDNASGSYAILTYVSDGPHYAGFYKCEFN